MGSRWRRWWERIVAYAPIIAVMLGWTTVATKSPALGRPAVWVLCALTAPALLAVFVAARRVHRGRAGRSAEAARPAPRDAA